MKNENKSIIYMVQCTINRNLIYVGKTNQQLEERKKQHEQSARNNDSTLFHNALIDLGFKNWEWNVCERCNLNEVYEKEKH